MSAYGLEERRSTLERAKTLAGGRVWQGSIADDYDIPRLDGAVLPHAIVDFSAPVKSAQDRVLANGEKGQPHILWATVSCVAGNAEEAQVLAAAVLDLFLDWKPSDSADPYEAKGGFGTRRPKTGSTPSRYIEGIYLETTVNQGAVA